MRLFEFVSVKLLLCLILGILIGFYFEPSPLTGFLCAAVAVFALAFLQWRNTRKDTIWFTIAATLATISIGTLVFSLSVGHNFSSHYSHLSSIDKTKPWQLKVTEVLKPTPFAKRYIVEAMAVENQKVSGKLLLSMALDTSNSGLRVDDEILVFTAAKKILPPRNPHQFDYRNFLEKKDVGYQITISPNAYVKLKNPRRTWVGHANAFRDKIIKKLGEQAFDDQVLAVMQALLLGERNAISNTTYEDYKNAGAVHILAVSGLHVGILLLIFHLLLAPLEALPKGKILKLGGILMLLWAFAFVAGLSPSVVRAVTMFSFLAYAQSLNRPTSAFNILALSMFFILLVQPRFLFQVGFQMSYAAVFAILWIYPKLQLLWNPKLLLPRKIWQLLSVSLAAQLGVLPLSLFYFHQFPALFFVSNLVVVPFLGIVLGMGVLVIVLALLEFLPDFLVVAYNLMIRTMNQIIAWVAKQEDFVWSNIPFDGLELVLGYALIITLVSTFSKPTFKGVLAVFLAVMALQVWGIAKALATERQEKLFLAHQTKASILVHQIGDHLSISSSENAVVDRIKQTYSVANGLETCEQLPLQQHYTIGSKQLYIIDSLAIYPPSPNIDYLVLTQSPKINLARLLDSVTTKQVIADDSNYTSYVQRWKATCLKKGIPFHHTGEKGAFCFDLEMQ